MREKLCKIAIERIQEYKAENNINEVNKYEIILKLLENENCFKIIDEQTAYSILSDLGFEKEQVFKIYNDIIYSEIAGI